ncbi:MAG: hypothetical protein ACO4CI_09085, partial [Phycisphaerales bacterium]
TGYFKVEVMLELDGERILSGLAANVEVEVSERDGLLVPSQAIVDVDVEALPEEVSASPLVDRRSRSVTAVFVVRDGKAMLTPVSIGPSNLVETLVLEGVEEGEVVVTGPYKALEKLEHGAAVKPRESATEAAPAVAAAPADAA